MYRKSHNRVSRVDHSSLDVNEADCESSSSIDYSIVSHVLESIPICCYASNNSIRECCIDGISPLSYIFYFCNCFAELI